MFYYEIHKKLSNIFDTSQEKIVDTELGISIHNIKFESVAADGVLTGSKLLKCDLHHCEFDSAKADKYSSETGLLGIPDYLIKENLKYTISVIKNSEVTQVDEVVILFHGLNEKKWDKYLPWAYELVKKSNVAVLLYPISFHMDRAPEQWSDRKLMFEVAQHRGQDLFENSDSSYVNAAISSRMEAHPQRMFWSGLQSYSDVIEIVNDLRAGNFEYINANAKINLFGYSIGSFLSVILMMSNPNGIFSDSKLFCFCGGMTIDRMFPISKYIMDARAAIAMQKVFAQLLTTNFSSDLRLGHYQDCDLHPNESWFKTMLRYNHFQHERESRFKKLEGKIKAYVLEQDVVAPPIEALNTLKGGYRSINIDVEIDDYPFHYTHMVPFPLTSKNAVEVTAAFEKTINSAIEFYKS